MFVSCVLSVRAVPAVNAYQKLHDFAELLTEGERTDLEERLVTLTDEYDFDVVIVTTNDAEGLSSQEYAESFYDENWFGIGEDGDGILLLINMDEREAYISTTGSAIEDFSREQLRVMLLDVTKELADGDYFYACTAFIDLTESYIGRLRAERQKAEEARLQAEEAARQEQERLAAEEAARQEQIRLEQEALAQQRAEARPRNLLMGSFAASLILSWILLCLLRSKHKSAPPLRKKQYMTQQPAMTSVEDILIDTQTTTYRIPPPPPPSSNYYHSPDSSQSSWSSSSSSRSSSSYSSPSSSRSSSSYSSPSSSRSSSSYSSPSSSRSSSYSSPNSSRSSSSYSSSSSSRSSSSSSSGSSSSRPHGSSSGSSRSHGGGGKKF